MRYEITKSTFTAVVSPVTFCHISAEKCFICWMLSTHTQNIHATFELQGLFNYELRLLGNVRHQALHCSRVEVLFNNHLHLLRNSLDLRWRVKGYCWCGGRLWYCLWKKITKLLNYFFQRRAVTQLTHQHKCKYQTKAGTCHQDVIPL